jgi:hypothetical protein
VHHGRRIHCLAVAQSRLESHFVGGCNGSFVQPMPKTSYNAIHVQLSVCPEHDFQENFSLELQTASFVRINRARLERNFYGIRRRTLVGLLYFRSAVNHLL